MTTNVKNDWARDWARPVQRLREEMFLNIFDRAERRVLDVLERYGVEFLIVKISLASVLAFLVGAEGVGHVFFGGRLLLAVMWAAVAMMVFAMAVLLSVPVLVGLSEMTRRLAFFLASRRLSLESLPVAGLIDAVRTPRPLMYSYGARRRPRLVPLFGADYREDAAWRLSERIISEAKAAGLSDTLIHRVAAHPMPWVGSVADVARLARTVPQHSFGWALDEAYKLRMLRGRFASYRQESRDGWAADVVAKLLLEGGFLKGFAVDYDRLEVVRALAREWEGSPEELFATAEAV